MFVLVTAIVVVSRPTPASVFVGFLIAAIGELIRVWAAGHLVKNRELVTSGPYRYTRNPLYLGRLLIFIGICVMARLPYGIGWAVILIGCIVFFGYYLRRKERVEPERLREIHGAAYDQYHRAVPALIPSLRPYPLRAATGWSSDRLIRNREHWMVLGILTVTLVLMWRANHPIGPGF